MSESEQTQGSQNGSIHHQQSNGENDVNSTDNTVNKPLKKPTKVSETPSFVVQTARSVFGFRKTSTTLFVILTYALVIIVVYLSKQNSLSVPSKEPSILASSWSDLQVISTSPHPYISHENDELHDYLVQRVKYLSSLQKYITFSDDYNSSLSSFYIEDNMWNSSDTTNTLSYFESSNVLAKVEGKDPSLPAILLSAHYDSVPTAYGSTDDGAGVASLLGILEHYASSGKQPLRTIIFNINNNEEFGLYGAKAFFDHPWSKNISQFVNLEGTGTGERAILFRATDYEIAKYYKSARSPFGNSIFQQGFASGLVHSETDYRIYKDHGLRGIDIAFYKPRSLYHTRHDSIQQTSKSALWHMLSNSLDVTIALAEDKETFEDSETPGVFFDILGLYFVLLPLTSVYVINIILLVVVPIVLIGFAIIIKKRGIWDIGLSWIRLPVSLVISGTAAKVASDLIFYINPLVLSRDFQSPLITVGSTFLFSNYVILTISQHFWPVHDFKLLITLETFVLLWISLVYVTVKEHSPSVYTGPYLVTVLYALYSVSTILGLLGIALASPKREKIKASSYGSIDGEANEQNESSDENAPLLSNSISGSESDYVEEIETEVIKGHPAHNSFTYDWSLQFLILVPVSFLLSYASAELVLEGLNQTVQESLGSTKFVFQIIFLFGILLTTPLLSFAYKLNSLFAILLIISIGVGGLVSIFEEPFTSSSPLKLRFVQTIDLDNGAIPTVNVFGREGFIESVLKDLPSVKKNDENITCKSQLDGLQICSYESERPYLIDGSMKQNDFSSYLDIEILKSGAESSKSPYSPLTAEIAIKAKQNRVCSLTFNSTSFASGQYGKSPIRIVTYHHDKPSNSSLWGHENKASVSVPAGRSQDENGHDIFKWLPGIDVIQLHKLDWNQESYQIGLQWIPKWLEDGEEEEPSDSPKNRLGVHVSCLWGEYERESIIDGEGYRKIPAFDELLQFAPDTVSWTNRYEGLVKIDKYIEL